MYYYSKRNSDFSMHTWFSSKCIIPTSSWDIFHSYLIGDMSLLRILPVVGNITIKKKTETTVIDRYFYGIYWAIGLMSRVFANGPEDQCSIPGQVIPKTQKMVLDAALLNTQHYKKRIKRKVEQSRERSSALPYTSV